MTTSLQNLIDILKACPGFENITQEEAEEIVTSVKRYAQVLYNSYRIMKQEE